MLINICLNCATIKNAPYTGSHNGMRFHISYSDKSLVACVYPEPYSYVSTSEDQKTRMAFEYSEDGIASANKWINTMYEEKETTWKNSNTYI